MRAIEVVEEARAELAFELELVDIGGQPELETRYRELLPVVEIDGEPVFTYFVDARCIAASPQRRRLTVPPPRLGVPLAES